MRAGAPKIQDNPRIVKRLLNVVSLRRTLASNRDMNVDLATLAKLAILERCTDEPATLALFYFIIEGKDAEKALLQPDKVNARRPDFPRLGASRRLNRVVAKAGPAVRQHAEAVAGRVPQS